MKTPFLAVPAAFGHARHGIARGSTLRRLDGVMEPYASPGGGDVLLFKRPGLPAVPAALAAAAGAGREFRTYALISGNTHILHSKPLSAADVAAWLYLAPDGTRWLVKITTPTTATDLTPGASFSMTVTFARFGEFGGTPQTVSRTQTISDDVFGEDKDTYAGHLTGINQVTCHDIGTYRMRLEDVARTGGKACIAWTFWDQFLFGAGKPYVGEAAYIQYQIAALAEMTLSIDGGDGLPTFALANSHPRSVVIPDNIYTGPLDGSGCPFGAGSKHLSVVGRVVGAMYDDTDAIVPAEVSYEFDEQLNVGTVQTITDPNQCPDDPLVYPSVTDGNSATSTITYALAVGAASAALSATHSMSVSCDAQLMFPASLINQIGVSSWSMTLGGGALWSGSGGGGGSVANWRQVGEVFCSYDGSTRAVYASDFVLSAGAYAARYTHQVVNAYTCPGVTSCIGEHPAGLFLAPLMLTRKGGGDSGHDASLFTWRLANNLFALCWRNDTNGDIHLHALLGPGGSITTPLRVVACTFGGGDPDCQSGGYKFVSQSLPVNLGAITIGDLRGSHNPESGETVIATDGVNLCYV